MDNPKRKFQGSYLKTWSYLKAFEIKKNSCRKSIFADYCVVYNEINSFLLATGVAVQCLFCITLQNSHENASGRVLFTKATIYTLLLFQKRYFRRNSGQLLPAPTVYLPVPNNRGES